MVVNLHLNHQAQLEELKNESTNEIYQCPFEIFNFKKPCNIFGIFVGKFLHAGSTDILIFLDCLQAWSAPPEIFVTETSPQRDFTE